VFGTVEGVYEYVSIIGRGGGKKMCKGAELRKRKYFGFGTINLILKMSSAR
jgi:hypothetical protein